MSGSNTSRSDDYNPTPVRITGGGGGGGGGSGGSDPCDIVETVPLNSPQPAALAAIVEGQILEVNLNETGPRPVLEVLHQGQRVGALTHRNHIRIIDCIKDGRTYQVVVVSKRGGAVEVRIEPA